MLLSFIATAAIALIISATLVLQEMRRGYSTSGKPSVLRRKLLNAYSDQQILTGIGIQGVGLAKVSVMVPYHFFIIWMLSLLSMAVHNATLLALARDFRRDWVLRWLRQLLMLANLALSCAYGVYVLRGVQTGLSDSTLPVACVWSPDVPPEAARQDADNIAASYAGTIAVIVGNVAVFALATWYLHSRARRFYRGVQLVGLVLMTASAVGATARVVALAQAFSKPPVPLRDESIFTYLFQTRFYEHPPSQAAYIDSVTGKTVSRAELKDLALSVAYTAGYFVGVIVLSPVLLAYRRRRIHGHWTFLIRSLSCPA